MPSFLRASLLTASGAVALTGIAAPAQAQVDRGVVLTILQQCAKIDDQAVRTVCYDTNIRLAQSVATPAGQRDAALDTLRECAKIGDTALRTSCFDRGLARPASPTAGPSVADQDAPSTQNAARASTQPNPALRESAQREPTRERQADSRSDAGAAVADSQSGAIDARVTAVVERRPGAYLLTLEDGSRWEFLESMPATYWPPQRGSSIRIEPGTLGSFLLRFDRQRAVRVQRLP